jgi:hypothetical protein
MLILFSKIPDEIFKKHVLSGLTKKQQKHSTKYHCLHEESLEPTYISGRFLSQ